MIGNFNVGALLAESVWLIFVIFSIIYFHYGEK